MHLSNQLQATSKMAIPKLFLYKAAKANTVVILRRGETKETWEMIRWNLDTDTFTEGQWLIKKQMNGAYASISPCGRYFGYFYQVYGYVKGVQKYESCGVVSQVPNFTALYFNGNHGGCWESVRFTEKGEVVSSPMEKKGDVELPIAPHTATLASSGYIDKPSWTDPKGRIITTEGAKLLADGIVIYDTTDHKFVARSPQ